MPKGDADFYVNTNAHLDAKVAMLEHELAAAQAREAKLRDVLASISKWSDDAGAARDAQEALALPTDDSALREMIESAKAEERDAIIAEIPGGHSVDPQWVCDMIRTRKG